jgi:hypothetical protein
VSERATLGACAAGWLVLGVYALTPLGTLMAHGPAGVCGAAFFPMFVLCCGHWTAMCLAMLPASAARRGATAWAQFGGWIGFGVLLVAMQGPAVRILDAIGALGLGTVTGVATAGALVAALTPGRMGRLASVAGCCLAMTWCFTRGSLADMACVTLALAVATALTTNRRLHHIACELRRSVLKCIIPSPRGADAHLAGRPR